MEYSIYVLLIPMVMFLFLGLFQGQLKGRSAGLIGTAGLAVTAVLAYWAAFDYFFVDGKGADGVYQKITEYNWVWLRFTENLHIDLGVLLDPISCMMLVVITTVSLMVHIYSLGYMKGERGFARYYAFLSLFSFSMLGLVVATNIFQMYIFWELVGVSSYLLIGFYYTRPAAIAASKKAILYGDYSGLSVNFREDISVEVLREKYATQHAIGVISWFEFDSKVTDHQKLAALAMKAS